MQTRILEAGRGCQVTVGNLGREPVAISLEAHCSSFHCFSRIHPENVDGSYLDKDGDSYTTCEIFIVGYLSVYSLVTPL
jgi:hypothetical protein